MRQLLAPIGFTGTQNGMTAAQFKAAFFLAAELTDTSLLRLDLHHGDCIGADAQMHEIARELGWHVTIHPPIIGKKRAWKDGDVVLPEDEYMARNRHIVDAAHAMIATPKGFQEELRSGTWSAIRYAKKNHRQIDIIWPNGDIERVAA